jgi:Putative protein-S-isoprenylcysteine methyltransferase
VVRTVTIWWFFIAVVLLISRFAIEPREPFNWFWLFTLACWAVLDCYWAALGQTNKTVPPAKQSHSAVVIGWMPHALYCLPLSSVPILGQRLLPNSALLQFAGATMCALGVGFAMWARRILAHNWNATVTRGEEQQLVQNGPYAVVRHPIYSGFLAALLGMLFALGEVRAVILLAGGAVVLLKKMKHEEAILDAAFPDDYRRYQQRVARVIPWIW